jgi:hypothetical protein
MAKAKITKDEARQLAAQFREASTLLGDYLYDNWAQIAPPDRDVIRSLEVTLLNLATDLVTQAAGITLDNAQASLKDLEAATQVAKKALKKINQAKKAINVVTALIGLAAAIPTGNIVSIVSAIDAVKKAAQGASDKKDASGKGAAKTAAKGQKAGAG